MQHKCENQWKVFLPNVFDILKIRVESNDGVPFWSQFKTDQDFCVCLKCFF